ncbi:MAG: M23 family metallopeptidase [Candidatus Levyibacteriota bacterium]
MKVLIKHGAKVKKGIQTAHALTVNPFEYVLNRIVAGIVSTFIPIPFVGELVVMFKKPVLWMLASLVITTFACIFIAVSLIVAPAGMWARLHIPSLPSVLSGTGASVLSPAQLKAMEGYLEPEISDADIPSKDPFGGNGTGNSIMTAAFHDLNYYTTYHLVHEGMDLVPSQNYYNTNKAYLETKQVIMFATINGTAHDYIDSYGALTVDITNKDNSLLVEFKHLKQFIMTDGVVRAGQPVGVMGATGFAFGEHLHYQIETIQGGSWIPVDPISYIN